jgi:peptide/nickel transport system permease protein
MTTYIIRRLLLGLLVLLLVTIIIFCFMRLLPGDPLYLFIDPNSAEDLTPEARQMLEHQYGLDKSLPLQYFDWIGGVLRGDLGKSTATNGESVNRLIASRIHDILYRAMAFILGSLVLPGHYLRLQRGNGLILLTF